MQTILVSCEAAFKGNFQTNTGPVRAVASYDTKIGCIRLVWAGAKIYTFSFLLCTDPLRSFCP